MINGSIDLLFSFFFVTHFSRPELKPVEKEVEVVIKFPEVDPLNPPVLTLNEIAFKYNTDKVIFDCVNLNASLESRICIVSHSLSSLSLSQNQKRHYN